jgi:uncharacterized protein (TIGR02145 family)
MTLKNKFLYYVIALTWVALLILSSCKKEETPTLTTVAGTDITTKTGVSGGNITSDGGAAVTARGVVWSTEQNPTVETNQGKTSNGTGTGKFTSNITNLQPGTAYYVRAYATNSEGTSYGNHISITTLSGVISLTTAAATSITATAATCGGNITSDGGAAVTLRGIVWSTEENPTVETNQGITTNGTGNGSFTSNLTNLSKITIYYVRAYATNSVGTVYGNQQSFTTKSGIISLTTTEVTSITATTAVSGGYITSDGGSPITEKGIIWGTAQDPTQGSTTNGTGTGSFTSNLTNLQPGKVYYVQAYAINSFGSSYGNQISFTTATLPADVTNPATGKTWLDRNSGASRVATSSTDAEAYGDLHQWGRGTDGHEKRNSPTTSTLSSSDTPGHGNFILAPESPYDWRSPQNTNLWQGVNGTNNPCPTGYRLPTEAEWNAERLSWGSNNATGAFASPLKLPVGGYRSGRDGSHYIVNGYGNFWSSTVDGTYSRYLVFGSSNNATMGSFSRVTGLSVRCLKD